MTPHKDSIKQRVREMAFEDDCDLIAPIGELCFFNTMEVAAEANGLPIAFVGVRNPVGPKGVNSLENPVFTVTGVFRENAPPSKIAKHIAKLYPDVKSIVIPYFPTAQLLQDEAIEIKRLLSEVGMTIYLEPIETTEAGMTEANVTDVIKAYQNKVQAVCLLESCATNFFQEELGYFCWEKCLLSIGSTSIAIDAGFSCSFAGDLSQMAAELCRRIRLYCEDGVPLESMPIAALPDDREFVVNIDMFRRVDFPATSLKRICLSEGSRVVRKWINVHRKLIKS
ncbi:MAG: transporter substrate binding protein [Candidatus Dependentiae bacterium]|nr:transporter substrate binding protein [Candidatus Dependentiae bacterium]